MKPPKFTQEMIDAKLREIQESIPKELLEFDEKSKTPALEFLADKLLEDKNTKSEVREELARLKRQGIFSQKVSDLSEEKKKKVMEYVGMKIRQAIQRGELPHPNQSPFMRRLRNIKRK